MGGIESFNPRMSTPKDVVNSISDYNQGMVSKPPEYYIDITCKPYGTGYEVLLACQQGDRYFDVILQPMKNYETNQPQAEVGNPASPWAPGYTVFQGCKIVDTSERYSMGTAPTVTFSCRALRFVWGQGDEVEIQADIIQDFSKIDKNLFKKIFLE